MKMFDRNVRTLKDMQHVSDLRKYLLSLGALDEQGCKFLGTDGALKITKGSMTDLKVECTANLYKVIGSVLIGDASVVTEKEDTIKLWHMRLEHMSE